MILDPDYSTTTAAPWTGDWTLQVIHDAYDRKNKPVPFAPRNVLKKVLELYKKETFIVDIPKIFILSNENQFKKWYNLTYSNYLFFYVKSFQEGLILLKKKGGVFIFNTEYKINLPSIDSLILTSPYYIISIPNHPYIEWISSCYSLNIKLNNFLTLSLHEKDYQFIEESYEEKFIFINIFTIK